MTIITTIYSLRKRLTESQLEKLINILEDERKRRKLERDDEVITKNQLKEAS